MIKFHPDRPVRAETLHELLQEIEKRVVVSVIKAKGGHMTKAADFLGIERSGLYKLLKRHGMSVDRKQ